MKVSIDNENKLIIVCESENDAKLFKEWFCSSIRQYRHNYHSNNEFIVALDINSIIEDKNEIRN